MIRNIVFDIGNVLIGFEPMDYLTSLFGEKKAVRIAEAVFGTGYWQELDIAKLSVDGKSGVMEGIGIGDNNTFQGEDPSWAPDNRHVTLTVNDAIYVIDTRLGAKRKLVSGSGKVGQSNWSPILK